MGNFRKFFYFFNIFGITLLFAISLVVLRNTAQIQNEAANISKLSEKLEELKSEKLAADDKTYERITNYLDQLDKNASSQKTGGATEVLGIESPQTFVTINDTRWENLSVYQDKSLSTPLVGKLQYSQVYPLLKKETPWLLVKLPDGKSGWVQSQYVKEVIQ